MSTSRLETIEIETAPSPSASIIWLHGLGADGNDFAPIVPEIDLGGIAVRYVFPNAPTMPVTVNNGYVMRAWYDIADAAIRREVEAGVRASQAAIETMMSREKTRGIAARRIVLAGFSQGGAIALFTGLRHAERIAGIMALSTYVPLADKLAAEAQPINRDLPVFMAHGSDDTVIPITRAAQSRELLEQQGYALEWHQDRMPHSVCPAELGDIQAWLRKVLA